jgi:hypothetical protein
VDAASTVEVTMQSFFSTIRKRVMGLLQPHDGPPRIAYDSDLQRRINQLTLSLQRQLRK